MEVGEMEMQVLLSLQIHQRGIHKKLWRRVRVEKEVINAQIQWQRNLNLNTKRRLMMCLES